MMNCWALTVFTAPGHDYALPIEAVGHNKLRIQPDRKSRVFTVGGC